MKKIKIAQIGINLYSHSLEVLGSISKQTDCFELVGYVLPENEKERIPNKAQELIKYPELTLNEVLQNPEIEAVAIETDEIYLTKYALLAAKAGKHIHMEKPGGISLPDFEELISIMRKTGKVFHVGYMYRYNPYVKELMKDIPSGKLGDIISVEAQMNCGHPTEIRKWLKGLPGGIMFFLGCHLVDLVLQIKGEPRKIDTYNKCSGTDNVIAEDFGMAVFEYDNGASFVKVSDCEIGGFYRRQLVVSGTKATVEMKPLERYDQSGLHTDKTEYLADGSYEMSVTEPFDRYDGMMRAFAEYVRGEKQNPFTLDYELSVYKTVLKCCDVWNV